MSSELLKSIYFNALDEGEEAYIQYVKDSEIVEFIEIGDQEIYNFEWEEEWEDLHDSWRKVAEVLWRE